MQHISKSMSIIVKCTKTKMKVISGKIKAGNCILLRPTEYLELLISYIFKTLSLR